MSTYGYGSAVELMFLQGPSFHFAEDVGSEADYATACAMEFRLLLC